MADRIPAGQLAWTASLGPPIVGARFPRVACVARDLRPAAVLQVTRRRRKRRPISAMYECRMAERSYRRRDTTGRTSTRIASRRLLRDAYAPDPSGPRRCYGRVVLFHVNLGISGEMGCRGRASPPFSYRDGGYHVGASIGVRLRGSPSL